MQNMRKLFVALCLIASVTVSAWERQTVWPKGKMPHAQKHQIAAMTDESGQPKFNPDKHRVAYLEWFDAPAADVRTGGCMILISGGSYEVCCDVGYIKQWRKRFTELGFQCVNFVYRTPRPVGLPIYQTAWEDGQRAVRMVRSEAKKRGFDPEKIGVVSMSAGSHLALLLATSSQTPAYAPVDKLDSLPCHINWAVVNAPAYVTTDGEEGTPATRQGYGSDVRLSKLFKFDAKTCPMSLHHGGKDIYSPNGSTLIYRELRKRKIPAEVHIYPNIGHRALGLERAVEFMRQMGYMGKLAPEERLIDRYASDEARRQKVTEDVWPQGKMPSRQENQCEPYLEWHFPKELKTKAIQIIYSGGSYNGSKPDSFEVAPARRYLNERGMTVVTLKYRVPRPPKESGLAKHTTAWQDLQRTIRIVRSKADSLGLDPKQIGIMGSSAGGHLTLLGTTSSMHQSYQPIDDIDKQSCRVQWGIAIYPAYGLTDGIDRGNTTGGNADEAVLVPEFSFDLHTAPMLFVHGDADGWAAMNSVKAWEKLRAMGIQSELHTLAKRKHCFQRTASPGTGSYTWLDRIGDFLKTVVPTFPAPATDNQAVNQ
jgi:acetyl esterase/lipase